MTAVIITVLFFVIIANGLHYMGGGQQSSFIDKDSADCMKGVAAILIVFSHAHYYIPNLGVLKIFKPFGYIGVSLFFFCSGYGVMKKYSLDSRYMDGFLQKRLKGVYLPYIVTTVLWFVVNALLLHETYDLNTAATEVIQSVLLIKTSLPFAWYVLAVLVWYCIFFLTAKIIREPQTMLRCLIVLNVIWYIVGILTGVPSFYYNGTCCIIIGCAVAIKNKIKAPSKAALISSVVGLCFSIIALHFWGEVSSLMYTLTIAISSSLFILFMYIVGYDIRFHSKVTKYIGKYSYEIYLTQGIAYVISKEWTVNLKSGFWIVFLMSMVTFIYLERKIIEKLTKRSR